MEIGIKGISYSSTERKYLVRVKTDSKRVYVGRYSSLEEAKEALESYTDAPKTQSTTPILESLRATFAPKSAKTSKSPKPSKVKSLETTKNLPKPVQPSQKGTETSKQIDYHKLGEATLLRILSYLIKEADKRGTSVFDVVVQEVAKLSK